MIRQEQYEIWVQRNSSKWDILGSFKDLEVATSLAKNYSGRTRLVCVTFEFGKLIAQESIAETGFRRKRIDYDSISKKPAFAS
jgi:hypothetical protein